MASTGHGAGKAFYGIQIREFRNLDEVTARLSPINVFVGRNNAGKTNLISAVAILDPTLFLRVVRRALLSHRGDASLSSPIKSFVRGSAAKSVYGTVVGVRTTQGKAIILDLEPCSDGLSATWSENDAAIARFQVSGHLNSYVVQYGDAITKFDRRRHRRKSVALAESELAVLRERLFGHVRVSLHGEWDLSDPSINDLERDMLANREIVGVDQFIDQMVSYFDLPTMKFAPVYGLPMQILPSAAEYRRHQLRVSRLKAIKRAIEGTLDETKTVGRELLGYIDELIPPEKPMKEHRELLGGALQLERQWLPAKTLGAGYRSLLSICHKILVSDVCLIDEPEAYLHPSLQERLATFMVEQSSRCQMIITTHSHVMINALFERGAAVFEIADRPSEVNGNIRPIEQRGLGPLLDELGLRASHLLQTNAVIWTEGQSDRLYLRRWIDLWSNGRLVYGRDFVVVSYGGSQLSHLATNVRSAHSAAESLRRIARHSIYVMDSDKDRRGSPIDERKLHLLKRAEHDGDIGWITTGRELENYIPLRILKAWGYAGTERDLLYADVPRLIADLNSDFRRKNNKMAIARQVVPQIDLEDIVYTFDLGTHVDRLCAKLWEWSGRGAR
ncbi:AAA family ATPase [Actinoplanes sp. NEAU-A12]|uniref:AAA family ATPase n=1 Tax=Actinoplanes sandaracinus TaxID=3045177 RepID=A0ABT6WKS2_9ACTN|nr:AAA family ATPase [Actinoplanes sandaracinus]MDI6100318.1 AAA family ATPase [Actinoplanes sandaracinus]